MPNNELKINLLDVGEKKYGDCILCQFGDVSVLIDGAHSSDYAAQGNHPSIPEQIGQLLNQPNEPYNISLLIVTHPHEDHIGCLPRLIENEQIHPEWALVADPQFRWGNGNNFLASDYRFRMLIAALQEESHADETDVDIRDFLNWAPQVESNYSLMIANLKAQGTKVVRHAVDTGAENNLKAAFASVGLKIYGPSRNHLDECARLIQEGNNRFADAFSGFMTDSSSELVGAYRQFSSNQDSFFEGFMNKGAINLQSIITGFEFNDKKILFAGDFQFSKPEVSSDILRQSVRDIRKQIRDDAPYSFVKLSHHGSYNGFSEAILTDLKDTKLFGINGGEKDVSHPDQEILDLLNSHRAEIEWVRTDHNGQVNIVFPESEEPQISISKGEINDATPNTGGNVGFGSTPTAFINSENQPKKVAKSLLDAIGTTFGEVKSVRVKRLGIDIDFVDS